MQPQRIRKTEKGREKDRQTDTMREKQIKRLREAQKDGERQNDKGTKRVRGADL